MHRTPGEVVREFEYLKIAWLSELRELCCHIERGWVVRGKKHDEDDLDPAFHKVLAQEEVDLCFRFLKNKVGEIFGRVA